MKKILFLIGIFILTFFFTDSAFAQEILRGNECLYDAGPGAGEVVTIRCILPVFANAIYWLLILSGVVAVFLIMFGGIKLLASGGDQARLESAKKTIIWAIVGLVVVMSSFMIVNIVADLTKVTCITNFGFTSCGGDQRLKPCNEGGGNAGGYCPRAGQVCGIVKGAPVIVFRCQWPCGSPKASPPNSGWCSGTRTCKVSLDTGRPEHICK